MAKEEHIERREQPRHPLAKEACHDDHEAHGGNGGEAEQGEHACGVAPDHAGRPEQNREHQQNGGAEQNEEQLGSPIHVGQGLVYVRLYLCHDLPK